MEPTLDRVKLNTPAKINLHLRITASRDDGYHELESFMVPIGIYDEITISRSQTSIHTTCPTNPELNGESNLAHKAALAWLEATGEKTGLRIEISKKIPVQAGLGGGSSDAAATLTALQKLGEKPLSDKQLHEIALQLGADVPFFLDPLPRVVRGVGEILGPRQFPEPFYLVIAYAPQGLSTRKVFENLIIPLTFKHISVNDEPPRKWGFEQLERLMKNDLQPTAERLYPDIARVQKELKDAGASNSSLTGSGPSVFSIFADEESARQVLKRIDGSLGWTYLLLRAIT